MTATGDALAGLDPDALFKPVANRTKIGLAVSGGPDSLALLVLYAAWREHGKAPGAIVYAVDHGLRPEGAQEAELVRRIAVERGFEVRVLTWSGEKPQTGLLAAARAARYRMIGAAMAQDGADILMTAHHLNDQAETVLMRLAHGSGAQGLGAMRPFAEVEGVSIYRPLLGVSKETLVEIVNAHGLVAADDPTNADLNYERARWRAMRPGLEKAGLTPERLAQFAERMQRLDRLAAQIADDIWKTDVRVDDFGVVHIAASVFGSVPDEAGLRVFWRALRRAGGGRRGDLSAVETLYGKVVGGKAPAQATLMGAVVVPGPGHVLVYREAGRKGLPRVEMEAFAVTIWDGRFAVQAPCPVVIEPSVDMTRQGFIALAGHAPDVPVAALRAAPTIRDKEERVLAVGARIFDERIKVWHVALT
nr:tRNA lysidine(34) synthetase TilS [Pelagibacterium limicola]